MTAASEFTAAWGEDGAAAPTHASSHTPTGHGTQVCSRELCVCGGRGTGDRGAVERPIEPNPSERNGKVIRPFVVDFLTHGTNQLHANA